MYKKYFIWKLHVKEIINSFLIVYLNVAIHRYERSILHCMSFESLLCVWYVNCFIFFLYLINGILQNKRVLDMIKFLKIVNSVYSMGKALAENSYTMLCVFWPYSQNSIHLQIINILYRPLRSKREMKFEFRNYWIYYEN